MGDWRSLAASRVFSEGGPQAITMAEMLAYCHLMRVDHSDDRKALLQMVQALDSVYIRHHVEKIRRGQAEKPVGDRPVGGRKKPKTPAK